MEYKILHNRVKCLFCKDIIESKHRHDFVTCSCGRVSVDGGKDYLRRSGCIEDWFDLSDCIRIQESAERPQGVTVV